jgi:hypothetical protein
MSRYTFKCEHFDYQNLWDKNEKVASTMNQEFRADDLSTVLENFEMFLRGAGFYFEGHLDIVNEDDYNEPEEETTQTDSWAWTVNSLLNPPKFRAGGTVTTVACEVCGLDKSMMKSHNCYDDNCPVHAPKSANASEA